MEHIGIDLGTRKSHFCIRDEKGQTVAEGCEKTTLLKEWLTSRPRSHVVIESCAQSVAVARLGIAAGHKVTIVPATLVRQLGVGHRGVKNDVLDARVLSRASYALGDELPSVYIRSRRNQERSRLLRVRSTLVSARTKLINCVKAMIRAELIELGTARAETIARRVQERLAESAEHQELYGTLEPVLESIDAQNKSIAKLDKQLAQMTQGDEHMERLQTIPGVGPLTAAALVSTIDDIARFEKPGELASYCGLCPGENSSGTKKRFTSITKAGNGRIRALLIQASWSLVRTGPHSALAKRYIRIAERKSKQIAIVATARRLLWVVHAMMRNRTTFDPSLGASKEPAKSSVAQQLCEHLRVDLAAVPTKVAMST